MVTPAMKASRAHRSPSAAADPIATAAVDSLSYDGRGVARLEGKTVFIEGALPGERVRFRYLNRRKSYDNGTLVEILEASPDRATPPCTHFGSCGGCGLQHLRSEVQIQSKQKILAEQLTHIGRVQPLTWLNPVTGPALGYRRRARLGVWQMPETGGVSIGFRARRENYLVDLNTCLVLEPKIAGLLPELHRLVDDLSCPNRIPQIETATGDNISALTFRHLVPLVERDREILRAFGERHAIQIYLQGGGPDTIIALWPAEPEELLYRLPEFDVEIRFRPADFVQVNSAINRQMVSQAIQLLDLKDDDQVLDLFCGLGNFTLALARRAKKVLGLEADVTLIEGARRNAQRSAIDNAEFRVADLYRANSLAACKDYAANKWLLDPPRGGAMEVIQQLTAPLPSRIVYVSCYPATLARDSDYLVHTLGYRLAAAGVMDMFPQTSHVESMALFDRP